ncbi:MAG: Amylo-alpha-1,6-glucosidase [Methanocella sp. PtaU1.Bin125]|nr:MAG: Amylo-alpha-1,6-glucosidase [Methanocella sp. PtaU1.Bin125]
MAVEITDAGSHIHRSHTLAKDISDALVIRERNITLVTLRNGDIPIEENYGYGLYYHDTRFLSGYTLRINGKTPVSILSSDEKGYASVTVLTNPELSDLNGRPIDKATIGIRRDRFIAGLLSEAITIENFNDFPVAVEISLRFYSDFDDIFTIRGITGSTEGTVERATYNAGTLVIPYKGKDGHQRNTIISFEPAPSDVSDGTCRFYLSVGAKAVGRVALQARVEDIPPGTMYRPEPYTLERRLKMVKASYVETMECCSNVQTNNEIFNKVFLRSLSDLRMLYMMSAGDVFYSAGVPWYDALFGRDSIISSIQVIPYNPAISKSTLQLLARHQGKVYNDWRDEEPGKILHELRVGEKANLDEIPQNPYYGSVDSTPLFLIGLAEHIDWTGDMGLFHELEGNVDAALAWIDAFTDKDGFLRYSERSTFGLYNQGWKDSIDAISHADGSLARPPIALAEVQGYVYMAKRRMAMLYDRLGMEDRAKRLRKDAANLYWNFNEKFWMEDKRFFAQALDASGRCEVISSNPAQALWGEIVDRAKAEIVIGRLFEDDMDTGWGIRTLSSKEVRYNPLGYHNGSVWPHDNSMIAMGLGKYGHKKELLHLFTSMYEAAGFYPIYRLPELFGGFQREDYGIPIKYPVANSPQAWASGSVPYMLTASLGFRPDALGRKLTLMKPALPDWLLRVKINSVHVGNAAAKLEFQRMGESTLVNVMEKRGDLEVDVVY